MRTSIVNSIRVLSLQFSSIIQAGDSVGIAARSQVLAVQRQKADYLGNEGNLAQFPIFSQRLPELPDESVSFRKTDPHPEIRVDSITIYGMSTAAVLQIGSNRTIDLETRTKHIRQLLPGNPPASS